MTNPRTMPRHDNGPATHGLLESHGRLESHNANVVDGVAHAGGCGLKNLQDGDVCGRMFGHDGPCNWVAPADVADLLASYGIEL
jgi:hypothetical protein